MPRRFATTFLRHPVRRSAPLVRRTAAESDGQRDSRRPGLPSGLAPHRMSRLSAPWVNRCRWNAADAVFSREPQHTIVVLGHALDFPAGKAVAGCENPPALFAGDCNTVVLGSEPSATL